MKKNPPPSIKAATKSSPVFLSVKVDPPAMKKANKPTATQFKLLPSPSNWHLPMEHLYMGLPIYSTLLIKIRGYKKNSPSNIVKRTGGSPSAKPTRGMCYPYLMWERFGSETIAFPTLEFAQTISHLRRGHIDEDALAAADALLVLSLKDSLSDPSYPDSDDLQKLRSDLQDQVKIAVHVLGETLVKETVAFLNRPNGENENVKEVQTKPVRFFKKVIGTIKRLKKVEHKVGNPPKRTDRSLLIIEAARLLTQEKLALPTQAEVQELMENYGWGFHGTHDGKKKLGRGVEEVDVETP